VLALYCVGVGNVTPPQLHSKAPVVCRGKKSHTNDLQRQGTPYPPSPWGPPRRRRPGRGACHHFAVGDWVKRRSDCDVVQTPVVRQTNLPTIRGGRGTGFGGITLRRPQRLLTGPLVLIPPPCQARATQPSMGGRGDPEAGNKGDRRSTHAAPPDRQTNRQHEWCTWYSVYGKYLSMIPSGPLSGPGFSQ